MRNNKIFLGSRMDAAVTTALGGVWVKSKLQRTKAAWTLLLCALALTLVLAGCSKKDSGSGSGGGSASAKSSGGGKANPATDFFYYLTKDGQGISINGYWGESEKVVIPAKIEDIPVVEISDHAFSENNWEEEESLLKLLKRERITSVIMPDSVTKIGNSIFDECRSLTEIRFSDNIEDISYLGDALYLLKKANLPRNLKRISKKYGDSGFSSCGSLIELIIPSTLQTVEVQGDAFFTNGRLPLKTRQRLQELGYTGEF